MKHMRRQMVILWLAGICALAGCAGTNETQVLVVGTVHQQHARNPNYSYRDIVQILVTYDPDVIGVEIQEQDFRREPYLKEMMLATVWGLSQGKAVYPIDWSSGDSTRQIRARLQKEPEYIRKAQQLDSLTAESVMMRQFEEKYGDFWQSQMAYQFYNGSEYNEFISEAYRLSMEVYGDSPINLHYQTRNTKMMDLIREVIDENPGRKVVVLTGAEHKHFFDRELQGDGDVSLIQIDAVLPLAEQELTDAIRDFFEAGDDLLYYADGYPADTNAYYRGKLVGLVHGPNMDWNPEIIPDENIGIAGKVLARWREATADSSWLMFELGWHSFLREDYRSAIDHLEWVARRVDEGSISSSFVQIFSYRNLGLCYDAEGERAAAIRAYTRAEELMRGTPSEGRKELILRDYLDVPYEPATDSVTSAAAGSG